MLSSDGVVCLAAGFLSGVGIICFAASYAFTLALEVTRLFFRSGIRGAFMIGFAGAGLFAHTVYLYYEAIGATGSPLSSNQDWCLVAAWVLAITYLYLVYYHPKTSFGVFILPLVLALIGVGTFLADSEPFPREPASKVWGVVHAASILLATVAVLVGFAAGLMYLGQAYRLKRKLSPQGGLRLPSLEWLRRTNSRAVGIALLMLAAGILSGMVLNLINYGRQTESLPWHDPVVLSTVVMFGWLAVSAGTGIVYRPAREGRKVAFLTMVSFVFLVIALGMVLLSNTQHGGTRPQQSGVGRLEGPGGGVQGLGFRGQELGARGQGFGVRVRGLESYGVTSPRRARILWGTFPTCLWVVGTLETCPTLGLVQKQLRVSGRGQSHFRCAKIGTVPNVLLDNSLGARVQGLGFGVRGPESEGRCQPALNRDPFTARRPLLAHHSPLLLRSDSA